MTLLALEIAGSREEDVVKAEFSDGSSLTFTFDYLSEKIFPQEKPESGFWEAGRELAPGEEEAFRFAAVCYRAEKAALKLIARAEQSSLGLTVKLEHRGFPAPAAGAVVSRLQDRNLLDDERYAELWLRSRLTVKKAVSPQWLLVSLAKRGIERSVALKAIEKALDPEAEFALLLRYLEKNVSKDCEKAGYLRGHLKFEGFSSAVLERYFYE